MSHCELSIGKNVLTILITSLTRSHVYLGSNGNLFSSIVEINLFLTTSVSKDKLYTLFRKSIY